MGSAAYSPMIFRSAVQQIPKRNQFLVRQFQRDAKEAFQTRSQRIAEKQTLREKIMAPAGPNGECWQLLCIGKSCEIEREKNFSSFQHSQWEKEQLLVLQSLD